MLAPGRIAHESSRIVALVIDINGKLGDLFQDETTHGTVWRLTLERMYNPRMSKFVGLPNLDDDFWVNAFTVGWWQDVSDGWMNAYFQRDVHPKCIALDVFAFLREFHPWPAQA